jgi:L-fuconolactonase
MNRRTFLQQAAGALAVTGNTAAAQMVVDSHHHFWDPVEQKLKIPPPREAVLDRAFLPEEFRGEIRQAGVQRTVLVQGNPQTLEGNDWLFDKANKTEYISAVVAWIDLLNPKKAEAQLDKLAKQPKFVGIRHLVEPEPDVNWIVRDAVIESLRILARRNVRYDMLARPHHLPNVLKVLDRVPDLRMVVDHLAKPDIAGGKSPGWRENIAAIAKHPGVYCKLSGMITEADWRAWKAADLKPYVDHVTNSFGWDRVMYGSDWPVCLLAGSYQQVWKAIHDALGKITPEQHDKVFGANAVRFYGLKSI